MSIKLCYNLQVHTTKLYLAYKPCLAQLKQQQSGAQMDVMWMPCVVQPHITLSLPIQEKRLRSRLSKLWWACKVGVGLCVWQGRSRLDMQ